jgi:hypothetical protein
MTIGNQQWFLQNRTMLMAKERLMTERHRVATPQEIEQDPTAVDPDEAEPDPATLPDKPPIEEMPSGDEDPPEEEDVHDDEFLPQEAVAADPTIDNEEQEEQPHTDLPDEEDDAG